MKITFLSLLITLSLPLFASSIPEIKHNVDKIEKQRESQREILSMEIDMREFKRSGSILKRERQATVVSKMIQLRDSKQSHI